MSTVSSNQPNENEIHRAALRVDRQPSGHRRLAPVTAVEDGVCEDGDEHVCGEGLGQELVPGTPAKVSGNSDGAGRGAVYPDTHTVH